MGLPGVLAFAELYVKENSETRVWGWFMLAVGGHECLLFPVILIGINS